MSDSCDRTVLLIAARAERDLTAPECELLEEHLSDCRLCRHVVEDDSEAAGTTVTSGHSTKGATAHDLSLPIVDPEAYEWDEDIGRGGMGRIVRARDRRLRRQVAIKELLSDRMRARFEREALITARLQHPAIVPIYEAGQWPNGEPFYAMKMVEGSSLAAVIAETPSFNERLAMLPKVIAVADALAYAHSEGVIHRDLKPANVLVGAFGETVVIDWGIAKDLSSNDSDVPATPYRATDGGLTIAGQALGTPAYMPPEQARGDAVDERADVYAVGAMLYHLLAGRAPYRDTGVRGVELLEVVERQEPTPLRELQPEAPADLLAIVEKAMSRDPNDRYVSAGGLAADLERFQTGKLVSAYAYSGLALARRWVRRHRGAVSVAVILVLVLAAGGVMSVTRIVSERNRADSERAHAEEAALQAMRERSNSDQLLNDMLRENGRREYMEGKPARALTYLRDTFRRGDDSFATRMLLGHTMPTVDSFESTFDAGDGEVLAVGFQPSGSGIVAVHLGDDIVLHDAKTSEVMSTLRGDFGSTIEVSFSADGARAIVVNNGHEASVYAVDTGSVDLTLPGGGGGVIYGGFSPASDLIAIGTDTGRVTLFDATTGASLHTMTDDSGNGVDNLVFSRDGARFATTTLPLHHAKVWDVGTGKLIASVGDPSFKIRAADLSPDGTKVAAIAVTSNEARVFDATTGKPLATLSGHEDWVSSVRFSSDSRRIVTASRDNDAGIWNADTGALIATLEGHTDDVSSAVFSPDGSFVVTASADWSARLWDAATGFSFLTLARQPGGAFGADLASDGATVITTSGMATVDSWRVSRGRVVAVGEGVTFERKTGELGPPIPRFFVPDDGWLTDMDAHTDTGRVLTVATESQVIDVWEVASETIVRRLTGHEAQVSTVAFSADGARVASGDLGGGVRLWDAASGEQLHVLECHDKWVSSVAFSADGSLLVSAGNMGRACVWDVEAGSLLHAVSGHTRGVTVTTEAIAKDNSIFVTSGDDGLANVWDMQSGERLASLRHGGAVRAYLDDSGERVIAASDDRTARLWNARTGELIIAFEGHDAAVWGADMDTEGRLLLTSAMDGVRLWEVSSGALVGKLAGTGGWLSVDGRRAGTTSGAHITVWDVTPETRDRDAVSALIGDNVPYECSGGRLVATQTARVKPHYVMYRRMRME